MAPFTSDRGRSVANSARSGGEPVAPGLKPGLTRGIYWFNLAFLLKDMAMFFSRANASKPKMTLRAFSKMLRAEAQKSDATTIANPPVPILAQKIVSAMRNGEQEDSAGAAN